MLVPSRVMSRTRRLVPPRSNASTWPRSAVWEGYSHICMLGFGKDTRIFEVENDYTLTIHRCLEN